MKTRIIIWLGMLMLIQCNLEAVEKRPMTSAEDDTFRGYYKKIKEQGDQESWRGVENLPSHILLDEMINVLPWIRSKPEMFERFRSILLGRPDWTEWVQWKIDWCREQIDKKTEQQPRGIRDMGGLLSFLEMLGTAEVVPFYAQYLEFPYSYSAGEKWSPLPNYAYQYSAADALRELQIPGGPESVEPLVWKQWWKKNAHLYEKGPDGKVHGPAPTRRGFMNCKIPAELPLLTRKPSPSLPPPATPSTRK
jgi:hypothetical protein